MLDNIFCGSLAFSSLLGQVQQGESDDDSDSGVDTPPTYSTGAVRPFAKIAKDDPSSDSLPPDLDRSTTRTVTGGTNVAQAPATHTLPSWRHAQ